MSSYDVTSDINPRAVTDVRYFESTQNLRSTGFTSSVVSYLLISVVCCFALTKMVLLYWWKSFRKDLMVAGSVYIRRGWSTDTTIWAGAKTDGFSNETLEVE